MKAVGNVSPLQSTLENSEQIIVDRIYKAVMEQKLAPETKLSEADLCETFGVGRMKVRRALLLLSSQGIVDLQSNRGAYVASPTPEEAKEVFDARLHIEPSIVGQITQTIDEAGLKLLREHIVLEKAAKLKEDRSEIIRLSGEFHVKMIAASQNSLLTRIIKELVTRTSLIVGLFGSGRGVSCREDEHEEILKAIELGDKATAKQLVRDHLIHIQKGLELSRPSKLEPSLVNILRSQE